MASIKRRAKVWYLRYRVNGREHLECLNTHDERKATTALQAKQDELKHLRRKGRELKKLGIEPEEPDRQKRLPLVAYLGEYKNHYLMIGGRDLAASRTRSWVKESAALRRFVEFAAGRGVTKLDRVTPALIEDYKRARAADPGRGGKKLSDHTVNHTLRVLKAFLYHAKRMGYIKENPVCGIKPVKTAAYEIRYLRPDAVAELLKYARPHPLHALLAVAVYAGLREAELAALEWPSVNFAEGFISVRNTETFRTKSRKPRMVPLAPALAEILKPLSKDDKDEDKTGLCFVNELGKPYKGVTLTHRVGRLRDALNEARADEAKKAGAKKTPAIDFTLHTLRRTFATLLRLRGVALDKISKWLGHSSVKVTEGWYSELPFDGGDDDIAMLDFRDTRSSPKTGSKRDQAPKAEPAKTPGAA